MGALQPAYPDVLCGLFRSNCQEQKLPQKSFFLAHQLHNPSPPFKVYFFVGLPLLI